MERNMNYRNPALVLRGLGVPLVMAILIMCNIHSCVPGEKENQIPFREALDASAIVQEPMASGIPGSMILGNGDLNGILWVKNGQLRFSITKNDACDGRHETENDPEMCTIDVKKGTWNVEEGAGFPPSWSTPYPTPLICGYVDLSMKPPFSSRLDIGSATATVAGSDEATVAEPPTLRARVLADRNVVLLRHRSLLPWKLPRTDIIPR